MLYSCKIKIKPKYEILAASSVQVGRGRGSLGQELASGEPSPHLPQLLGHSRGPMGRPMFGDWQS